MSCQQPAQTTNDMSNRKKRRGMIEKRRRDKINNSLSELRRLVPAAFEKQGSAKLEKAEILQMTVEYLKMLHERGLAEQLTTTPAPSTNTTNASTPTPSVKIKQDNSPPHYYPHHITQAQLNNTNFYYHQHQHAQMAAPMAPAEIYQSAYPRLSTYGETHYC